MMHPGDPWLTSNANHEWLRLQVEKVELPIPEMISVTTKGFSLATTALEAGDFSRVFPRICMIRVGVSPWILLASYDLTNSILESLIAIRIVLCRSCDHGPDSDHVPLDRTTWCAWI